MTNGDRMMLPAKVEAWKGVPIQSSAEWRAAFSNNPSKIRVGSPCPLCGCIELFRWHDGGRGLWEWCNGCGAYEHAGWHPEVTVRPTQLTVLPSSIVEALSEIQFL